MSYHPLSNDSGSDDANRRSEGERILKLFRENGIVSTRSELPISGTAFDFLAKMERLQPFDTITVKQLFFLRDIRDQLMEKDFL